MGRLSQFCNENDKLCNKVKEGSCISYADPTIWEKYGGCPLNSIPAEVQADEYKAKKALEKNRFKRNKRR